MSEIKGLVDSVVSLGIAQCIKGSKLVIIVDKDDKVMVFNMPKGDSSD